MSLHTAPSLYHEAHTLLKRLIATPSLSREEDKTADLIQEFLHERGIQTARQGNNVWAHNRRYDAALPTVLLNSHHDTVKPNQDWTLNPFEPLEIADERGVRLHGLGSNDAGGALVSLIATFVHYFEQELPFNVLLATTAEEEIMGRGGIESVLGQLGKLDVAIVGEPTGSADGSINLAIAEKGLLVLDCTARGKSGHAARDNGVNAIALAMQHIDWFHSFRFPKESPLLGPVKMSVTIIQAGTQHNMIPDRCTFTVDVRTTDAYTNEETLDLIKQHVTSLLGANTCEIKERSTRLRPSSIDPAHPLVQAAREAGLAMFASPTMSDQTLIPVPSVKIGPGMSERSHTADEFLYLHELERGIATYIALLEQFAATFPKP